MDWKSLRNMVLEDDTPLAPAKPVAKPEPAATPIAIQPTVEWAVPNSPVQVDVAGTNEAYSTLKQKIDFTKTTTYEMLQKYLAPMASMSIPEVTKYQIALGQIKSIEGIEADKLLSTFDGLKANLIHEQEAFDEFVSKAINTQVDPQQDEIERLTNELESLKSQIQERQSRLSNAISKKAEAEAKIAKGKAQFNIAAQIISKEIEGDRAKYSSLLQG